MCLLQIEHPVGGVAPDVGRLETADTVQRTDEVGRGGRCACDRTKAVGALLPPVVGGVDRRQVTNEERDEAQADRGLDEGDRDPPGSVGLVETHGGERRDTDLEAVRPGDIAGTPVHGGERHHHQDHPGQWQADEGHRRVHASQCVRERVVAVAAHQQPVHECEDEARQTRVALLWQDDRLERRAQHDQGEQCADDEDEDVDGGHGRRWRWRRWWLRRPSAWPPGPPCPRRPCRPGAPWPPSSAPSAAPSRWRPQQSSRPR